ncbi:MAG: hypothetical protein WC283_03190 [Candidatus Paceibacterota bacterium]|jgi:hypothetical protein|nr:hypothetical protein [Candidatus Dojkabacteria bacterium]
MKSYYDGDLIIVDDGDLINHNLYDGLDGLLSRLKRNIIYKASIILHISDNMTIKCLKNRFASPELNVFPDDVNKAIIDFKKPIKLKLRNKKLKRIINDNN